MKNPTVKEKLQEANATIAHVLHQIGEEKILDFLQASFEEDLYDFERDIEDEQNFANENKTGAYKSAGTEARSRIKYMKKVKKEHQKLLKMFSLLLKQKQKIQKMW